jgi:hypothetical protein
MPITAAAASAGSWHGNAKLQIGSAEYLQAERCACWCLCATAETCSNSSDASCFHHHLNMPATQNRSVADSSNPLCHTGILQHVLSYVGPGHWWYVATVCSLWRDLYQGLESVQMVGYEWYDRKTTITCTPQTTLYGAVFESASRVRLAEESLDCTAEHYRSAAGRCAGVEALAAAHELGMPYTSATMHRCALCNKLSVMQFLHAQGCPWDESVCTAAAERGCYEMLRWAHQHGCDWEHQHILQAAASSGNIEMTAWVMQQPDIGRGPQAMYSAAARGHTAMCAFLRSEGSPWHKLACCAAAEGAHADTLRWLHEHGCPWIPNGVYLSAAKGGSIDALSYLQQQGIEFTAERLTAMLLRAGAYSKLAAAQWLRQQGAEWPDVLNVDNAEWSGEVLAWARAAGCTSPVR